MPEFVITPYVGVGPVRFGMTREEVRSVVGEPVHSYRKGPFAGPENDAFDTLLMHVSYREPGVCDAVEFGGNRANPTLDGQPLLEQSFREVYKYLLERDPALQLHGTGITSLALGVGIYMSSLKEEEAWNEDTEGVIVFERGYYDRPVRWLNEPPSMGLT